MVPAVKELAVRSAIAANKKKRGRMMAGQCQKSVLVAEAP
jgi:hypothetical protein